MQVNFRTWLTITLIMGVVAVMCLMTGSAKDVLSDYYENPYVNDEDNSSEMEADESYELTKTELSDDVSVETSDAVIYVGTNTDTEDMVESFCTYTQKNLYTTSSVSALGSTSAGEGALLLVDGSVVSEGDSEILSVWSEAGSIVVFSQVPSDDLISSDKTLRSLMGISDIKEESTSITGVWLYEGFLLGGEAIYEADDEEDEELQDLDLNLTWYELSSGTTTYMSGRMEDEDLDNEELPPILWKSSTGTEDVYVVNADYMEGLSGMGFLSAMLYDSSDYYLYPVVNSQNFVVTPFYSATEENTSIVEEIYARDTLTLERDIIWAGVTSIVEETKARPGTYYTSRIDNSTTTEADTDALDYFFRMLRQQKGEAGICVEQYTDTDLVEKLTEDYSLLSSVLSDYVITSAYIGDMDADEALSALSESGFDNILSLVVSDGDELLSYASDDVVALSILHEADSHTYSEDILEKSIETALAYSMIRMDTYSVIYPEDEEDEWQNYYKKASSNTDTYWKDFDTFEETSPSEAAYRTRAFLTGNYDMEESTDDDGNTVLTLSITSGSTKNYFVLRTHGDEISDISGGSYEKIEDNAYLITAEGDSVVITIAEENLGFQF